MIIQRRRYRDLNYFVEIDENGNPLAVSQSLKAIFDKKALTSEKLLQSLVSDSSYILPPCEPSKIVCVGLNYKHHALEMNKPLPEEPLIFLKPPSSLTAAGRNIILPDMSSEVHYEGELAVIMGEKAAYVSVEHASDYIAGFTIMNDVTARDLQRKDKLYTRSKGFDTFAPLGPCFVTDFNPSEHEIETRLNGAVVQESSLDDMIFSVYDLVSYISHIMTLYPGDVISTGTPSGVGEIKNGDKVSVSISGIGNLVNYAKKYR